MPVSHPKLAKILRLMTLWRRSGFRHWRLAALRPPFWIAAQGRHACLLSDGGSSAKTCYREVIVEDGYRMFTLPTDFRPAQIVDVGANIGTFSTLCALLFPDACIHAYEPSPPAFSWLIKNAEGTSIVPHQQAVAAENGRLAFDPGADSGLGRLSFDGTLDVESVCAEEIGRPGPIDLLKMDCEGGEWSILPSRSLLQRTGRICMEYHVDADHSLADLRRLLADGGHEIIHLEDRPESGSGLLTSVRR